MFSKTSLLLAISFSFIGLAVIGAQDAEGPALFNTQSRGAADAGSTQDPLTAQQEYMQALALANQQTRNRENKIRAAAKAMHDAESSSERETAKAELKDALSEDYDARLDSYEAYLGDLEKQLEKMKERLVRRRAAKDEMIELKIKVLEAEADDLGWPTNLKTNRYPGLFRLNSDSQNPGWSTGDK